MPSLENSDIVATPVPLLSYDNPDGKVYPFIVTALMEKLSLLSARFFSTMPEPLLLQSA